MVFVLGAAEGRNRPFVYRAWIRAARVALIGGQYELLDREIRPDSRIARAIEDEVDWIGHEDVVLGTRAERYATFLCENHADEIGALS